MSTCPIDVNALADDTRRVIDDMVETMYSIDVGEMPADDRLTLIETAHYAHLGGFDMLKRLGCMDGNVGTFGAPLDYTVGRAQLIRASLRLPESPRTMARLAAVIEALCRDYDIAIETPDGTKTFGAADENI